MIVLDTRYLPRGGKIVAGISGGPDSLCLLDLLRSAGYPVVVAHLNHRLRPEAEQDAMQVAAWARQWNIPCVTEACDVLVYSREQGMSVEEAARLLRYRFLFETARRVQAQAVAVGHTADDQVETVLMHFLRGAGLDGLKGMQPSTILPMFDGSIPLVRPLLHVWRHETETFCRERGFQPIQDASNTDQTYFRNRLRHTLIPELQGYNPRFKEAILRSTQALADDQATIQVVTTSALARTLSEQGDGYFKFRADELAGLEPGMRRNLFRRTIAILRPGERDLGYDLLQAVADFCELESMPERSRPVRLELKNGLSLFREGTDVILSAWEADLPSAQWPQVEKPADLPADSLELGGGWTLYFDRAELQPEGGSIPTDPWSAWLDADSLPSGLLVRPRQPGDRFQPLGMSAGSVKISDFFINHKLPLRARKKWPLVCCGEEIIWVPGYRMGHRQRVTEATHRLVKLRLEKN